MTTPESVGGGATAASASTAPSRGKKPRKKRDAEGRMRLAEHLIEFRNRLIISVIAVLVGAVGGFLLTTPALDAMRAPIEMIAEGRGGGSASINWSTVTSGFDVRMQMALTLGVVLSAPVWLYQVWMFLMPGLKKKERRYALGFIGAAIPLFLAGCVTGWYVLPRIIEVMSTFAPTEDTVYFDAVYYYRFTLMTCLAVGIAFIVPVALVLMNFAGVITGKTVLKGWRVAVLVIALFAATATPAADVISMFMLMVPMVVLYLLAAGVCLLNDRSRRKRAAKLEAEYASGVAPAIE